MRKIICIPSRSGLFGPFNVSVILFVLFYVSTLNFSLGLRYKHVFQMLSNNQTYLECKSDFSILRYKIKLQYANFNSLICQKL